MANPSKGKVRVKCQGPGCGKTFWSASSRAKFCTAACRSRSRRKPAATPDAPIVAATRLELGDQVSTLNGQLALKVAEQIDKGSASVSQVRELQALVAKAVGAKPQPTVDPD